MSRHDSESALLRIGPRPVEAFERAVYACALFTGILSIFDHDLSAALVAAWSHHEGVVYDTLAEIYWLVFAFGGALGLWSSRDISDKASKARRRLKSEFSALFICSMCLLGYSIAACSTSAGFSFAGILAGALVLIGGTARASQIRTDLRGVDSVVKDGTK